MSTRATSEGRPDPVFLDILSIITILPGTIMPPGIDREQDATRHRQTRRQAVSDPRNPSMSAAAKPPGHAMMRRYR
nr:hypothetical protein [Candidatus Sigynarchaeum springense]